MSDPVLPGSVTVSPDGRPGSRAETVEPIIVFDGFCGMCSLLVSFVLWVDGARERHRFAPAQSAAGAAFYETLPGSLGPDDTFLYVGNGTVLTKGDAVRALLIGLGTPWNLLGRAIGRLPTSWVDRGYDAVARNRYSILRRRESCRRPPPGRETRFLP